MLTCGVDSERHFFKHVHTGAGDQGQGCPLQLEDIPRHSPRCADRQCVDESHAGLTVAAYDVCPSAPLAKLTAWMFLRAGFAVRGEMGAKDGVVSAKIIVGEDQLDAPTTTGAAEAAQDTMDWWNRHTGST